MSGRKELVLSIFFGDHDSNVSVATRDRTLLHLETERVYDEKHISVTSSQMHELIQIALDYVGGTVDNVDEVLVARWSSKLDLSAPISIEHRSFFPIITGHHSNHIGTALPADFEQCLILCADGWSEDGATTLHLRNGRRIDRVAILSDSFLTGRVYGTATQLTVQPDYMKANSSDTGKMLGLSAHGTYDSDFATRIRQNLADFNRGNMSGVDYMRDRFGLTEDYSRNPDNKRKNFAATVQREWESELLQLAERVRPLSPRIAEVGGCAMNVVANAVLENSSIFESVYVPAAPTDAGQSLGGIWERFLASVTPSPYLGRGFNIFATERSVARFVVDLLHGFVVALYSGRSESGPRALGKRSLLAIPSSEQVRIRVSEEIKGREGYRPVAPVIRQEDLQRLFYGRTPSPYMSFAYRARNELADKAPAVVHADGTSRVQTVTEQSHPFLHAVLTALESRATLPVLFNTSMNLAGKPVVDTPQDAERFLLESGVDVLYLGDRRLAKDDAFEPSTFKRTP